MKEVSEGIIFCSPMARTHPDDSEDRRLTADGDGSYSVRCGALGARKDLHAV